jgi:hypothetical protein
MHERWKLDRQKSVFLYGEGTMSLKNLAMGIGMIALAVITYFLYQKSLGAVVFLPLSFYFFYLAYKQYKKEGTNQDR